MLVPLINDLSLQNSLVAWRAVQTECDREKECELEGISERWNWLWDQVQYDQTKFGVVAGVSVHQVSDQLKRLIGYRLIYPDGTINDLAGQYLQNQVLKQLQGKK